MGEYGPMWICCWLGYSVLNIWLGRSKSWYFSTNEISHNGHFFILNNFWNLWLSYSSEIISFLLLTVCTVLSQQGIWREKNWDNYFGADSSRDVLFSVNRCVIRTILLCLLTKRAKIVFGNEKKNGLKLSECLISFNHSSNDAHLASVPLISVWEVGS